MRGSYKFGFIVHDQSAEAVRHHEAQFVIILPELIAQEPLVTENTCMGINIRYIIELALLKVASFYL